MYILERSKRMLFFPNQINLKIPIMKIIKLIFYFSLNISIDNLIELVQVNKKTVLKFIKNTSEIILRIISEEKEKLGGKYDCSNR